MNYEGIPIIIVLCYIVGELYKVIFKNKQDLYKLIPIILSIVGGILGVIIYKSEPSMMLNIDNVYAALLLGIISGASSTGANQIVKQVFMKEENKND